jgi:glucose/arabinose dehydrogenase
MYVLFSFVRLSNRVSAALLAVAAAATMVGCGTLQDWRDENKGIQLQSLRAATGYKVAVLATDLPKARHMVMGMKGTVFVGSMAGNVYALTMEGGAVKQQRVVIKGLTDPSGVAFKSGSLYVANRSSILRFRNIEDNLDNPGAPTIVMDGLPDKARHDAHAMSFGPDGKLYVSVGSPCNTCESNNDEFGTIVRINADGSGKEVVARGIRNSVGFDWHPQSKELWFTENGQDELGPESPNDELNRVTKLGEHFGFPYCHDRDITDPEFGKKRACSEFTPPAFALGPHMAALGMRFEPAVATSGEVSMLIARHGSHPPTRVGYDVVRVLGKMNEPLRMEPDGFSARHELLGPTG